MKTILLLIVLFLLSPYVMQVQADEWKNLPPDVQKQLTDLGGKEIKKEKIIEKETLKWLSSLDKGQYRKACNMLFGIFAWDDKEYENYVSGLKNARHTLGKMKSRKHVSTTSGQYKNARRITYKTVFENKVVKETINAGQGNLLPLNIYSYKITSKDGKFNYIIPRPNKTD